MPRITIPLGSKIAQEKPNTINLQIRNTQFWILGEKISTNLWNAYLINSKTQYKELIKENITTQAFILVANLILKTPFPGTQKVINLATIKKFLNPIINPR